MAKLSEDKLLSRNEVEDRFGITKRFLEIAAVRGDGPRMTKVGRRVLYQVRDLRDWIDARKVASTSEVPEGGAA